MKQFPQIFALFFAILFAGTGLHAADYNYTFAGAAMSGGLISSHGMDWVDSHEQIVRSSGYYGSGGLTAQIFANPLVGEYTLFYVSTISTKPAQYYFEHFALIKYAYQINEYFSPTAGAGVYFETPPSTRSYKGGGGIVSLGCIISPDQDWRITADIFTGYGVCSLGTDATKFSAGFKLGVTVKVGRM